MTDGQLRVLVRRREDLCRLAAGRALESVESAAEFLEDRGMLTRTPDCALPSLFAACQEPPGNPAARGFAAWPATKWWWAGALEQRDGVTTLKVHNGRNLLVDRRTLAVADPILRAELQRIGAQPVRGEGDRLTRRLLDHLAASGPAQLESVQAELGLHSRALRALRHPLERCGILVSRQIVLPAEDGHRHSSELWRYDQLVPQPLSTRSEPTEAYEDLVEAGVAAAVVAPARELARWFTWRWYARPDFVDRLTAQGRLRSVADDAVALGPSSAYASRS